VGAVEVGHVVESLVGFDYGCAGDEEEEGEEVWSWLSVAFLMSWLSGLFWGGCGSRETVSGLSSLDRWVSPGCGKRGGSEYVRSKAWPRWPRALVIGVVVGWRRRIACRTVKTPSDWKMGCGETSGRVG
jgi:hypothetical protein